MTHRKKFCVTNHGFFINILRKGSEKSMHAPLTTLMTTGAEDPSNLFVVLMGLCTVFLGLICIILIIELMTGLTRKLGSPEPKAAAPTAPAAPVAPVATPAPTVEAPIANREELVAAVCAAVAEELGTDVSALRVVSFRKV